MLPRQSSGFPPAPGLQRAPRRRQCRPRAARAEGLSHQCREVAEGVGDHVVREERFLGAPCRRLFQSDATVCHLPLFPLHLLTRFASCAETQPLQVRARPLVRSRIAGDAACRARRDRNGPVRPTIFDIDPLFKLDTVLAAQAHPLFTLLQIFLSSELDDLHAWQHVHADTTGKYGTCPRPNPSSGSSMVCLSASPTKPFSFLSSW